MDQYINEIHPVAALEKVQNGAILLDVREWEELEMLTFDVEGQLFIPLSELGLRFQEIPKDREIIIGCNSGNRSMDAARYLKDRDFKLLYNLKGGIGSWIEYGLPVQWENIIPRKAIGNVNSIEI